MKNIWGEILLGNQNFIFLRKYHCLHQKSFWPQLDLIKSETHSNYMYLTFKLPQVNKYKKVCGRLTKLCEVLHTDKSTNKLSLHLQSHWLPWWGSGWVDNFHKKCECTVHCPPILWILSEKCEYTPFSWILSDMQLKA